MTKIPITIPSKGRSARFLSDKKTGFTLRYISPNYLPQTFLFVPEKEVEEYEKVGERFGCHIIGENTNAGDSGARDKILDWAEEHKFKKLFMFDDDLQLYMKPSLNSYVGMDEHPEYFDKMVEELATKSSATYPIVGITARQFSQDKKEYWRENKRIIQFFLFYMPIIIEEKMRFTYEHRCMPDYRFVLRMLQKGYKNICCNKYCSNEQIGYAGGVGTWRTPDEQNRSAVHIAKQFPGLVSPYVKNGSPHWPVRRLELRIQWEKAYVPRE